LVGAGGYNGQKGRVPHDFTIALIDSMAHVIKQGEQAGWAVAMIWRRSPPITEQDGQKMLVSHSVAGRNSGFL